MDGKWAFINEKKQQPKPQTNKKQRNKTKHKF